MPPVVNFAGWSTYGFDNHRDGFNPNTTTVSPASIGGLHLAWQADYGDFNTQSQPVLAANVAGHRAVLFVGGANGTVYGYDGTSGTQMWRKSLGQFYYSCSGPGSAVVGIGGSVVYDGSGSIFVPANFNSSVGAPSITIVRLDAASGNQLGSVNVTPNVLRGEADITHTSLALANGRVYLGTGSTCDLSSWRGRVASADTNLSAMSVRTFYTSWSPTYQFSGGGVWGQGGVAVDDAGAIYTGVGNTDTNTGSSGPQPPFLTTSNEKMGYGDNFIKLAADLSRAIANNAPGASIAGDIDLTGSPMLFTPLGCPNTLAALQGKEGELLTYDTQQVASGPAKRLRVSPSSSDAPYLGNPGYSPITGLMYASVETSMTGISQPGLLAYKPVGCSGDLTMVWHASFGPDSFTAGLPRSAVSVTAGGVVFVGTPCNPDATGGCSPTVTSQSGGAMWAIDATNGTVLNNGKPIVITGSIIRTAPVIDANWVYVTDNSGHLYGFTTDPSVPAKAIMRTFADPRSLSTYRHR